MSSEQRIRAFLFYLGVLIFFIGLPFILSSALGYKFNKHTLRFTKAGLIAIKTQPHGASVRLNSVLLNEKTPASISELLPGEYDLKLELENHYPWSGEVNVEAGKVSRLDKIILFPTRPNMKQLNKEKISSFWVDQEKDKVYYLNSEENAIYSSDLEGEDFGILSRFTQMRPAQLKWKISPDKEKFLAFSPYQIFVVDLKPAHKSQPTEPPFLLEVTEHRLVDVFWHSDSYHLILVTDSDIEVQEAGPKSKALILVTLNKRNTTVFFDEKKDALYFIDNQKGADGKFYDNLFKLELGTRFLAFKELIKPKAGEP